MAWNYKELIAWQRAHDLTLAIYRISKSFPDDERFGMLSQIRRSAYSVPANIAEGSGRGSNKDYLRFLYMSRASLKEVAYFLLLAKDLGYVGNEDCCQLTERISNTMRPMAGLIKAIGKKAGLPGRTQASILAAISTTLTTILTKFA